MMMQHSLMIDDKYYSRLELLAVRSNDTDEQQEQQQHEHTEVKEKKNTFICSNSQKSKWKYFGFRLYWSF